MRRVTDALSCFVFATYGFWSVVVDHHDFTGLLMFSAAGYVLRLIGEESNA